MKLKELLKGLEILETNVDLELEIENVSYDSRNTKPGDLFVAMIGFATDGHAYIEKAVAAGAVAVLCQNLPQAESLTPIDFTVNETCSPFFVFQCKGSPGSVKGSLISQSETPSRQKSLSVKRDPEQ